MFSLSPSRRVATALGVVLAAAAVSLMLLAGVAPSARALGTGDDALEPPGLEDRETHLTLLSTHEAECTEVAVVRAVTPEGARALVPQRYEPTTLVAGGLTIGRFQMWDYVCERFGVDGQSHAPRTQISIGAIAVSKRDAVPVSGAYYLLYLATDNPVLAARYGQVGLPARFDRGLSATVSEVSASPFEVSFAAPTIGYHVTAVALSAPLPIALAQDGPSLFYEGGSGEVRLSYRNTMGAASAALVTGDYREHEVLAPIIALPRLLEPTGAPFPVARGDWDATVARLD